MAAENIHCVATDPQPGSGHESVVDGVAHGGVGGTRSFRAHIAFGGKAGHQVVARGEDRENRSLRHRFLHGLQVLSSGMQKEMDVSVDQAGHQRGVAEVDFLCVRGMRYRWTGFHDTVPSNEDFSG